MKEKNFLQKPARTALQSIITDCRWLIRCTVQLHSCCLHDVVTLVATFIAASALPQTSLATTAQLARHSTTARQCWSCCHLATVWNLSAFWGSLKGFCKDTIGRFLRGTKHSQYKSLGALFSRYTHVRGKQLSIALGLKLLCLN